MKVDYSTDSFDRLTFVESDLLICINDSMYKHSKEATHLSAPRQDR
jgi:hypothetical protein